MIKKVIVTTIILLIFISMLILIRHLYLYHTDDIKEFLIWSKGNMSWQILFSGCFVYAILLSIPFFPGVELGWLLILIFGKKAIILVYIFTLLGLNLSFIVGHRFDSSILVSWLEIPALKNNFNKRLKKIEERLEHVKQGKLSKIKFGYILNKFRYIILIILINTPGNSIIGGGGGISFICGLDRHFSWKGFNISIALAALPMPVLLYLGIINIELLLS